MYLAFKEIKKEKLRYGLIVFMIFLISYLIFILSGLAFGLASENTQAIYAWQTKKVILNQNSNVSLSQSLITKQDVPKKLSTNEALVGQTPLVIKNKKKSTVSAQFIGIKANQYIYKNLAITAGRKAKNSNEVVVSQTLKNKGYKLGDKLTLNGSTDQYKIVGFAKDAMINIAPIIYGNLATWRKLRSVNNEVVASGIISKSSNFKVNSKNLKVYELKTFLNKLPGYSAQNLTFGLMIGFLFIISLIIVAVFLYILTMQKLPNFAVMRAQGIPSKTLIGFTVSQSFILVLFASLLALILMELTVFALPAAVPMKFSPSIAIAGLLGMLIMGIIGSLIPVRSILKVDPTMAIGG
ncbi:ABC transporter permease [Lactobacillus mulieris]|jgi:peptide ABC transporter permease|uniref:Putative hemin transport system permease protein HrtB n=1 Tax=Lactobacillus mulieris TaxID=2508708 RepID=A0AAP3GXF4_9LACO|nr:MULTISPECIES: ABC transporter permease [Lactobacillus]EEU20981.1 hypothetical protein HMPREF0525_01017 [Lactobacillus jensenii 27-2-CHN]EEX23354.1 efflux ABC transporter, permease protein [Lactobacillus jensenii 115-3-CHN]EFH30332.1 efflux ABC transporter, permease protein [Lactobacillus jensenii JV-V16]KAA9245106.1 ABC transporter permease [Lactobacillus jensenii]KAA9371426.1 ABC transporter permease [Lactobacillus jensenii]